LQQTEMKEVMWGHLVRAPGGYQAFVPYGLPPKIQWSQELVSALSEADRALGRLEGVAETLANLPLPVGPFLRREAVSSSRIEGIQASVSDLFFLEAAPRAKPCPPDVQEVANYVRALEYGLRRQAELPVSLRLIREIHEQLLFRVGGEHGKPGEFRRIQNWIGRPGCTLSDATFVPPPPPQMMEALDKFEEYLHAPSDLPVLVRLAAIHCQFEAIHPFVDGNGRVGRLLITLLLCVEGTVPAPLLCLSAYFERNRQAYYQHLLEVSTEGRWHPWLMFFLAGVTEQATDAVERAHRLLRLREQFLARGQAARASALVDKLVDGLFNCPVTTVASAKKLLRVTDASAQGNINKLVGAGILTEVTGRKRNRVYVAEAILKVIEAST
jgi:Fic family protein